MRISGTRLLCAGAVLTACFSSASAQLVFGSTTTSTSNPCAMYLDVDSLQVTTLWNSAAQKKVNGFAADPSNGRLYSNDAARLNFWNYGSVGTPPTLIAGMYRTNDYVTFSATGVDGLAFANGSLYGATSYPSTVYKRGIYEIATTSDGASTPHCVMTPIWLDPTSSESSSGLLSLGGLEFNPANNLFYATNNADTTGGGFPYTPGLYSIDVFGSGAMTRVADFPGGLTKLDGMAIGGGKFWMTMQEPAASRIDIFPYDPVTGIYEDPIYVPLTDGTQRATGAAWAPGALAPEPAGLLMLALVALVTPRQRR
jgi:hypothetical protein